MLPPQCVPNTPQMMCLKKLNEWNWSWCAPQFVDQTQSAKQREDDDQCVRENAYLHVEPTEILRWLVVPSTAPGAFVLTGFRSRLAQKWIDVRIRAVSPANRTELGFQATGSRRQTAMCGAQFRWRVTLLKLDPPLNWEGILAKLRKYSNLAGLCAAAVVLLGPLTLLAQLSDLPIKAGLWETHVSVNHGSPIAGQSCFSAGTTLSDYLTATNKAASGTQCSIANKVQTAHGIAYDTACNGQSMSSKGHIDFQLPDAQHFSGTSHTTVTGALHGAPVNMAIDKTFTAKFLNSDCGGVKPVVVPSSSTN
jgi:hypothetical protein